MDSRTTLDTIKEQAEQGKFRFAVRHVAIPYVGYPAICYRAPDRCAYTCNIEDETITQFNHAMVGLCPETLG